MNIYIKTIIIITLFFSNLYTTFAKEGYFEKLLNINYGVEKIDINFSKPNNILFETNINNTIYSDYKRIDRIFRRGIIKKYSNGEFGFYQMKNIVRNYNNFIYHSNKYFYYLQLEEQNPNYREMKSAKLRSYRNLRSSFRKVKNTVRGY